MELTKSLYFLIPTFFIILICFPIFFEVRCGYNPLKNKGIIAIYILKIKILYYFYHIYGKYLVIENEKETKKFELEFSNPSFIIIEEFIKQVVKKIKVKVLYVYYNIGLNDAFYSALFCGLLNTILTIFFTFLKNRKPTASMCIYDTVSYNKLLTEIVFRGQISISLFDVAYSYLMSVIIIKRKVRNNI